MKTHNTLRFLKGMIGFVFHKSANSQGYFAGRAATSSRLAFFLSAVLGLATCETEAGLIVTLYDATADGSSELISLDARHNGDPFNVNGDRTPYRTLIEVAPGQYQLTLVDTVPDRIAWSAWSGGNAYGLVGLGLRAVTADLMGYTDTVFSVGMVTGFAYPTQQAAFDALSEKVYSFAVSSPVTLLASLGDHILGDNRGGISFEIYKMVETPDPQKVPEPASLFLVGMGFLMIALARSDSRTKAKACG